MKLLFFLIFTAALTLTAAPRQLLVDQDNPENWKGMVKYAPGSARGKGTCFLLYGRYPTRLTFARMIPISAEKRYTLKACFRTVDPQLPASAYLGLELYDVKKRLIGHCHVVTYAGTESEVVSARKGDAFLIVKANPIYKKMKINVVAFGAKKDYSDIPNFDISPQTKGVKDMPDGNMQILLKKPLKKDYPAGTPIRLHSPWSPSMYGLASGWMPAGDGVERTAILEGIKSVPGTRQEKICQFWKGTKYVRPFVWFGNWNRKPKKGAQLLVDGFSFVEEDKK